MRVASSLHPLRGLTGGPAVRGDSMRGNFIVSPTEPTNAGARFRGVPVRSDKIRRYAVAFDVDALRNKRLVSARLKLTIEVVVRSGQQSFVRDERREWDRILVEARRRNYRRRRSSSTCHNSRRRARPEYCHLPCSSGVRRRASASTWPLERSRPVPPRTRRDRRQVRERPHPTVQGRDGRRAGSGEHR